MQKHTLVNRNRFHRLDVLNCSCLSPKTQSETTKEIVRYNGDHSEKGEGGNRGMDLFQSMISHQFIKD